MGKKFKGKSFIAGLVVLTILGGCSQVSADKIPSAFSKPNLGKKISSSDFKDFTENFIEIETNAGLKTFVSQTKNATIKEYASVVYEEKSEFAKTTAKEYGTSETNIKFPEIVNDSYARYVDFLHESANIVITTKAVFDGKTLYSEEILNDIIETGFAPYEIGSSYIVYQNLLGNKTYNIVESPSNSFLVSSLAYQLAFYRYSPTAFRSDYKINYYRNGGVFSFEFNSTDNFNYSEGTLSFDSLGRLIYVYQLSTVLENDSTYSTYTKTISVNKVSYTSKVKVTDFGYSKL
jgi:hypothetical protein